LPSNGHDQMPVWAAMAAQRAKKRRKLVRAAWGC